MKFNFQSFHLNNYPFKALSCLALQKGCKLLNSGQQLLEFEVELNVQYNINVFKLYTVDLNESLWTKNYGTLA